MAAMFFFLRSFLERALTARPPVGGALREIDVRDAFPLALKLSSRARSPRTVGLVCAHVTAVAGGYGTTPRQRARWAGGHPVLEGDAELLALLERYHRAAYHWIGSRAFGGLVVHNHPIELRTSHGNGGNRGLGVGVDCAPGELEPGALAPRAREALIESGRGAVRGALLEAHERGEGGPADLVPHRAFSAGRRGDPGPAPWREIFLPVVRELGPSVARVDYELAEGSGRPVPISWDPAAVFDDRGRRLQGR